MTPFSVLVRSELLALTPAELRTELKYEPNDTDQLTDAAAMDRIKEAQGTVEDYLRRFVFPTQVQEIWHKPCLTEPLRLKWCDVLEVQELVAISSESVETEIENYQVIAEHGAAFLDAAENDSWSAEIINAWRVRSNYRTGMYGAVPAVPAGFKRAIRLQAVWTHMHPDFAGLAEHVRILLEPYERGEY